MALTVKDMMAAANAVVARVDLAQAQDLIENGALLLDVRDGPEVEKSGRAKGAHHVSRGMLELRADANMPSHDKEFAKDRPVVLYCGSGGRAALAGKVLIDMGYSKVFNVGSLTEWIKAGGAIEAPLAPNM